MFKMRPVSFEIRPPRFRAISLDSLTESEKQFFLAPAASLADDVVRAILTRPRSFANPGDIPLSYLSRLELNGTPFAFRRGTLRITGRFHGTDDSESGTWTKGKRGRRTMAFNGDFQSDSTVYHHSAPLNLMVDDTCEAEVWPDLNGPSYYAAEFVLEEYSLEMNPGDKDAPPVSGSISGQSNGEVVLLVS